MIPGRTSFWAHLARESLLGNRGLTKAVMALLTWAVIRTLEESRPVPGGDAAGFFRILFVVVCWILVCILTNDLADRREDLAAGKKRWIARLPLGAAVLVITALFGGGLAAVLTAHIPGGAAVVYASAAALGFLYSVRPFRLKRQGAWGILVYSLAGTAAYVVLPWIWMGASPWILAGLAPAVFLDKWVNIHFHQIIDHASDLGSGTQSYAVRAGIERAVGTLRTASAVAALWFAGVIVFVSWIQTSVWRALVLAVAVIIVLGSAYYSAASKRKARGGTHLVRELPFFYLGASYALFRATPLVLMARLALGHPGLIAPAAAAFVLVAAESFFVYSYRYE